MLLTTLLALNTKPDGTLFSLCKCRHFKLQITTCAENGKIQLTPKITNQLFTYYLNCTCKSNPVCLSQQWSVIFLLASYVQWHYFLSNLGIRKLTHWLFPIYVHSERVGSSVFHFFQWIHFCTTIQTDLLAYEFLRRSKSTLQYKSRQPHAPLRSHNFGSTSLYLFPKSAVLL